MPETKTTEKKPEAVKPDEGQPVDIEAIKEAAREEGRQEAVRILSLREQRRVEVEDAVSKREGWAGMMDEQDAGGGAAVRNRRDRPTDGPGNDLPQAPYYRILAPAIDPQTGRRCYNGITLGLPFTSGQAITDDRELAWRIREEAGYQVEVETRTELIVAVPLVPTEGREVVNPHAASLGQK